MVYLPHKKTTAMILCWFINLPFREKPPIVLTGDPMKPLHPYIAPTLVLHAVIALAGLCVLIAIVIGHPLNIKISTMVLAVALTLRVVVESGYRTYIRKEVPPGPSPSSVDG